MSKTLSFSSLSGYLPLIRVTTTQMNAIANPVDGMTVFNTTEESIWFYSTDWGWESNSISYKRKYGVEQFEEFMSTFGGNGFLINSIASGTVTASGTPSTDRPGIEVFSTTTSATGRASLTSDAGANTTMVLAGGRILFETSVRVPTLSTVSERFQFWTGITGTFVTAAQVRGVWFTYDEGGVSTGSAASANWQVACASASTRSFTTTSVAVNAGQFYKLRLVINAAATSVDFLIDEVLVKTETTNIPTTGNLQLCISLLKSIGTTARTVEADYLYFKQKFTTPR